jgi:uncharacterized membrane protein
MNKRLINSITKKKRYAKGEIGKEEFDMKKKDII